MKNSNPHTRLLEKNKQTFGTIRTNNRLIQETMKSGMLGDGLFAQARLLVEQHNDFEDSEKTQDYINVMLLDQKDFLKKIEKYIRK